MDPVLTTRQPVGETEGDRPVGASPTSLGELESDLARNNDVKDSVRRLIYWLTDLLLMSRQDPDSAETKDLRESLRTAAPGLALAVVTNTPIADDVPLRNRPASAVPQEAVEPGKGPSSDPHKQPFPPPLSTEPKPDASKISTGSLGPPNPSPAGGKS